MQTGNTHTRPGCVHVHTHTHTGRQNTPPGLASAFNYQTDRGEIKSLTHQAGKGEQGSQAEPEARTHAHTHTRVRAQTHTQTQLLSRRQAEVYRECKNMTLS